MAPCVRRWTGLCEVLTSGVDEVLIVSPRDGDLICTLNRHREPSQVLVVAVLHACAFTSLNLVVLVMQCSNAGK